jgi:hypothetical protein
MKLKMGFEAKTSSEDKMCFRVNPSLYGILGLAKRFEVIKIKGIQ